MAPKTTSGSGFHFIFRFSVDDLVDNVTSHNREKRDCGSRLWIVSLKFYNLFSYYFARTTIAAHTLSVFGVGRRPSSAARRAAAAVPARPRRRPEVSPPPPTVRPKRTVRPIRRCRRGHKTSDNVTSHPLRPTARHFGPFTAS